VAVSDVCGGSVATVLSAEVAPTRRVLVIGTGLVAVSLALFVLIAEDVLDGGGLISHDKAVLSWFVDHRTDSMISAARFVSTIGGLVSLVCVGALLGLWLWRRRWHLGLAVAPLASLLLAAVASAVAKAIFDRPRPPIPVHETHVTSPAFPSGHATNAAAFFLAAAFVLALTVAHHRRHQLALIATGIVCVALVGISRLVLAVHWLSDVVAGWALGTAIAITTVVIAWYVTTRADNPNDSP
jgi:undecaprenyl-diphosphatase